MSRMTMRIASGQSLVLAARRAAHAFFRRHAKWMPQSRPSSWSSVILRWPRTKAAGARVRGRSNRSALTAIWASQFHLHFNIGGAGAAGARMPPQNRVAATRPGSLVHLLDGRFAEARTCSVVARLPGLRSHPIRPLNETRNVGLRLSLRSDEKARFNVHFAPSAKIFMARAPQSRRIARAGAIFAVAANPSIRPTSVSLSILPRIHEKSSVVFFGSWHEATRLHTPREFVWHDENLAMAEPHSRTRSPSMAAVRLPELVWRTRAGGPSDSIDLPHAEDRSELPTPMVRSEPDHAGALATQGKSIGRTAVCATALDPALVDRIAQDVIQRVERRIRIERERRGI